MTTQEAIELLDNLIGMIEDSQNNDYDKAFRMAIEALKKQDAMQRVVERLEEAREGFSGGTMQWYYYYNGITDAIEIIKEEVGYERSN